MNVRVGQGYDLHKLTSGSGVTLGGVAIDCEYAIVAHSDGDVLWHSLCDALLGAIGAGDIGQHFPDSSSEWRQASSSIFVKHACSLLRQEGWQIANIDCTVISDVVRISPYRSKMQQVTAEICESVGKVNIKGTTHEGLGDIGAGRAIAAMTTVLLCKDTQRLV